jgi:hypothetical protein
LRITTARNDKGVGSSSYNSSRNNVGCLRVHASIYERNMLKDQRERIKGWDERT